MVDLPEEVIRRAQQGDAQAFEQILTHYEKLLCGLVARYFVSETDQEEALAEVYLALVQALPRFAFRAKFSTWLYSLTQRTCFRLIRDQHKHQCLSYPEAGPAPIDPYWDPAIIWADEQRVEKLQAALSRLNGDHRTVIRLRLEESRTVEETAQMMDKSYTAVTTLLYRALKTLRTYWEEEKGGSTSR
ncbi:MAG: RNA polymerase sigma factor [Candidatus Binatia bacterium]